MIWQDRAIMWINIIGKYILNVLIAFDQLANAFAGGDPDETISSRCAKILHIAAEEGAPAPRLWHWLGWFLETIDPGHLKTSHEDDEGDEGVAFWIPAYMEKMSDDD